MTILPSGLPEFVADSEVLSRFLVQSNLFNSSGAKAAAFLPNPKYHNTSVFRMGGDAELLLQTWNATKTGDRQLKGAATLKAQSIRNVGLEVNSQEPPLAHANIEGWPWIENDPEFQKARQLELANALASESELIRL
jgi:hypothetical protein